MSGYSISRTLWRVLLYFILSVAVGAATTFLVSQTDVMDVSLATSLGNILNSMTLWVQKGLAVLDIAYDTAKDGLFAAIEIADTVIHPMWNFVEKQFALIEHMSGFVTLSQPLHDAIIGLIFSVIFIGGRHHHVIWHQGLPRLFGPLTEKLHWPNPLRRRSTRKIVRRRCTEATCAILALLVVALLLSNSAAPPSMTGDKWFSTTHVQPKPFQQTAYSKHSHPVALNQQLAQTCSKQVVHVDDAQQPDVTLPVELAAPTTPTQALLTAPSRALMLRPPAAEPPAVPKQHVLLVEHQHTLVLRPLVLTLLLLSPPAEHPPHASLICTTVAAASSVQRLLGIGKVHSPVLPADGVQDHAQLPHLGHALCNTSCMCCLVGGIGQATTTTTSTLEAPLKAPSQHAAIYGARADSWLDRHGGSWLRTHAPAFSPMLPVMGASMLGCIFTGLQMLRFDKCTTSDGADTAPEDPMTVKLERAGIKAKHAQKRRTSMRISSNTQEFADLPPKPSVQQDWHDLLNTDSILASFVPYPIPAAVSDQADDISLNAPEPAGIYIPQPGPSPPMTNQQVLNQPVPTQPSPADPPTAHSSPDQLAAAVERDHISPTSHSETPAAPAEHAASQPAKVQRSPSLTLTTPPPAEAQDVHPCMTVHMEPAIEAKHVAPAVSAAIPQAAPVSMTTEDSVASAGCFRMFCCSKAPRSKQKKGSVWLECRQRLRKGVR